MTKKDDASGEDTVCLAKCKLPHICAGIKDWKGDGCGSGKIVNHGTKCEIISDDDHTCTSPGKCDDGTFTATAACVTSGW